MFLISAASNVFYFIASKVFNFVSFGKSKAVFQLNDVSHLLNFKILYNLFFINFKRISKTFQEGFIFGNKLNTVNTFAAVFYIYFLNYQFSLVFLYFFLFFTVKKLTNFYGRVNFFSNESFLSGLNKLNKIGYAYEVNSDKTIQSVDHFYVKVSRLGNLLDSTSFFLFFDFFNFKPDSFSYKIKFKVSDLLSKLSLKRISQININFLRKNKVFNKGRYSRNRQNYRTGVYWSVYINIIAVTALYFWFYRFNINFGYVWYFFYFFIFVIFWSKWFSYIFYKNNTIVEDFFCNYKWVVSVFSALLFNFLTISSFLKSLNSYFSYFIIFSKVSYLPLFHFISYFFLGFKSFFFLSTFFKKN